MAIDPRTMLFVTLAIAAVTSCYLAVEWRTVRERALLFWSAGFAAITIGCSLSPLRSSSFVIGIWLANGFLLLSHLLFLEGVAAFARQRVSPGWWALLLAWAALLVLPDISGRATVYNLLNALFVCLLALRSAALLFEQRAEEGKSLTDALAFVFLGHGIFYAVKTILVFAPGAMVNITRFKGALIAVSLFEGILVAVLIALSMTGSIRRRREAQVTSLAERDPLTGMYNRRVFEARAPSLLADAQARGRSGALLLLDLDHFKSVNDTLGHAAGDRLLVALGELLDAILPQEALAARLGGDEFAILLGDTDAAAVQRLGEQICVGVGRLSVHLPARRWAVGASIGAAMFAGGARELADLTASADSALYEAKRQGRSRICIRGAGLPSAGGGPVPFGTGARSVGPKILPMSASALHRATASARR